MKKILGIMLAVCMVATLSISALAASEITLGYTSCVTLLIRGSLGISTLIMSLKFLIDRAIFKSQRPDQGVGSCD